MAKKVIRAFLPILLVLVVAAFLRLYKIDQYMTFLGDEGRDVLVAHGILEGDFVFLGPRSSAADFYYGPIYYYAITPFLWLFNYDPVGPAIMVALLGIATVFLVYKVAKELFNSELAAITASALYAVSPVVIAYSRSSWNPNPLPFVSLLTLYLLRKAIDSKSIKLFFVIGILLGIAMQLQYLAFLLVTIVVVFTFVGTWIIVKKFDLVTLVKRYLAILIGFLVGFSPFIAFEVWHGFPNTRTILRYIFTNELKPTDYDPMPPMAILWNVLFRLFGRLITRYPPPEQVNASIHPNIFLWNIFTIIILFASIYFLFKIKDKLTRIFFLLWLGLGVGLFMFYKDNIYDYHFGFMFPLPFLLVGNMITKIGEMKQFPFAKIVSIVVLVVLVILNLQGQPFAFPPNRQKDQVKQISEFVLSKTEGKPFNFALITLGNSDHGYRYFFNINKRNPVVIEPVHQDPKRTSVTNQLLIVCEDPLCQPLGNSLWEVAGFGRAEIAAQWQVSVVKVYKLVPYQGK